MATLDLHLDFMNDHVPVQYKRLTAEEELQLTQDSVRLLEQINDDLRILDKMSCALENLILIQEHYEQYGTSPALEALVGDIKQYLGFSMEADEAKSEEKKDDTSTSSGSEEKGGFAGTIQKIWKWITGLFERIGRWLGICDKIEEANTISGDVRLNESSNYDIPVCEIIYSEGHVVDKTDILKRLVDHTKECFKFVFVGETGTQDLKIESSVSAVAKDINELKPLVELKSQSVRGSQIKELNAQALKACKAIKEMINSLEIISNSIKNKQENKKVDKRTAKAVGIIDQSLKVLTKAKQGTTSLVKKTYSIAYPNAAKAKEDAEQKKKNEEVISEDEKNKKNKTPQKQEQEQTGKDKKSKTKSPIGQYLKDVLKNY